MSEIDCWIHFDGPEPASVRPLLDAVGRADAPTPPAEAKQHALGAFLAALEARSARRRTVILEAPVPPAPPPPPPPPEAAPTVSGRAVSFEAWADLSIHLFGVGEEEQIAALRARGLAPEEWARLDKHFLRVLSDDLRAGRAERPGLYEARCTAEMARRKGTSPPPPEPRPRPRAPSDLRETAEAFELPAALRAAMGALPFQPRPEAAPAPGRAAAKTLRVPVATGLGGTLPLGDDTLQRAVAAVPFAGNKAVTTVVYFPALTVEQYVSLEHDLATSPAHRAEILRRYGVPSEASLTALEDEWRRQVTAHPELGAAIRAAANIYVEWLKTLPR